MAERAADAAGHALSGLERQELGVRRIFLHFVEQANPLITDLAKEARKYGLGLILSSQETRDFHPSIFANAGTQIVLALEDADAGIMAKVYAQEKKDQGMVKGLIIGQPSGVALIRSTHFLPYSQVDILSFFERIQQAEKV
jgi:DNA helicase HerA-like ATPase